MFVVAKSIYWHPGKYLETKPAKDQLDKISIISIKKFSFFFTKTILTRIIKWFIDFRPMGAMGIWLFLARSFEGKAQR